MATKKQLIERWQHVVRVLESLTPHEREHHFDMSHWGRETECGTVCCAAGHCALDPWFRRRGLAATFAKDRAGWPADWNTFDWEDKLITFFGIEGVRDIFQRPMRRPVERVIEEVRAHIKALKAAA